MPADTAAPAGSVTPTATTAQSHGNGAQPNAPASPTANQQPSPQDEMLEALEVPEAVRERARLSEEKERQQQQQQQPAEPAAADQPEGDRAGARSGAGAGEEEEHLSDEELRNSNPKLIKRIDTLTRRISDTVAAKDAEIAALKAQLEGKPSQPAMATQQPAAPSAQPPTAPGGITLPPHVAAIGDGNALAARAHTARAMLDWAEGHRTVDEIDGAERWIGEQNVLIGTDENGEEIRKSYTPAEIARMARNAKAELETWLPARQRQLEGARAADEAKARSEREAPLYHEIAIEEYPELADPESELSRAVSVLRQNPVFRQASDGELLAADVVSALFRRKERLVQAGLLPQEALGPRPAANANGNGNGAAHPAPVVDPAVAPFLEPKPLRAPAVPSSARGNPPPPTSEQTTEKAREDFLKSNRTDEDFEAFVNRLGASQSAQRGGSAPARV